MKNKKKEEEEEEGVGDKSIVLRRVLPPLIRPFISVFFFSYPVIFYLVPWTVFVFFIFAMLSLLKSPLGFTSPQGNILKRI